MRPVSLLAASHPPRFRSPNKIRPGAERPNRAALVLGLLHWRHFSGRVEQNDTLYRCYFPPAGINHERYIRRNSFYEKHLQQAVISSAERRFDRRANCSRDTRRAWRSPQQELARGASDDQWSGGFLALTARSATVERGASEPLFSWELDRSPPICRASGWSSCAVRMRLGARASRRRFGPKAVKVAGYKLDFNKHRGVRGTSAPAVRRLLKAGIVWHVRTPRIPCPSNQTNPNSLAQNPLPRSKRPVRRGARGS